MFLTETTNTNRKTPLVDNDPGLEGCSRDPEKFTGKGFDCYPGSGIGQNLMGAGHGMWDLERNDIRDRDDRSSGCGILLEKERECALSDTCCPQQYVLGTHLYTWVKRERGSKVPCLRKQPNGGGLKTGPPDPGFEAVLTDRPKTPLPTPSRP